jgi:hypothetical protein
VVAAKAPLNPLDSLSVCLVPEEIGNNLSQLEASLGSHGALKMLRRARTSPTVFRSSESDLKISVQNAIMVKL